MKTILDLVKANVELNNLATKLDEATTANETLQNRIDELTASHAEETAKLGAQHAEDTASLESKIKVLEEANLLLEEQQKSADEKAVEIAASVGVDTPVEEATENDEPSLSVDALWQQYNAIEGKQERRAFYLENIKNKL